jgi:transcriptional regulator with XRE-family HTH domain
VSDPTASDRNPDDATSLAALLTLLESLAPGPQTHEEPAPDDATLEETELFAALLEATPADDIAAFLDSLPQVSLTDRQQTQFVRLAMVTRAIAQHPATTDAFYAPGGAALATLRAVSGRSLEEAARGFSVDPGTLRAIESGVRAWCNLAAHGVSWIAREAMVPVRMVQKLLESAYALEIDARLGAMPAPATSLLRDAGRVSERRFDDEQVRAALEAPYDDFFRALSRETE